MVRLLHLELLRETLRTVSKPKWRSAMERITRDNSAVCLIDHQVGLLSGVRDITINELKHNVVGFAKAAQVLRIPVIVASIQFKADGKYAWLQSVLAVWDGSFAVTTQAKSRMR